MAHLLRLGVLASGSGSNLQSILDACAQHRWDVPARYNIAPSQDIPAIRVGAGGKKELVMLRWGLIPSWASDAAIGNRMINARSETASTKPAFPGMHGVRQAIRAGVRVSGCTVHFVDEGTDCGPILVQAAVPVLEGDTEESLAARILLQEHRIYPRAIQLVAEGRVALEGQRVRISGPQGDAARTLSSPAVDEP